MYRHGIAIGEDGKRVQGKPARAKERARVSRRRDEAEAWAQARLQGLTNDPAPINKIGMIYLAVNYPQLVDSSIEKDNDNRQANDATGKLSAVIGGEQQTDAHFNPLVERTRSQSDFQYPSAGTVILNPPTTNQVSTMMRINHGCPICFKHYTYDRVHDDVTTICCDKEVGRSCFEQSFHLIHRCWFCGTFNSQVRIPLPPNLTIINDNVL